MSYTVRYFAEAYKDLRTMPARYRQRALSLIAGLAQDPTPSRSKQLEDPLTHLRRLPLEQWRIIYQVQEEEKEVWIRRIKLKTGPETYAGLED